MMYSEFLEGTGCKQNEHNYKEFTDLEVMYTNSDLTKEQIYEYGKKLVDNSKSKAELEFEAEINEWIERAKRDIEWYKGEIERYQSYIDAGDSTWKIDLKEAKKYLKASRGKVRTYKDLLTA